LEGGGAGQVGSNLYKKLEVWQLSVNLIKDIYKIADLLPKSEEYNLKQQLKRAVVSVALNIAEGKNRGTAKDFANFLNMSVSSLAEVEAILVICEELGYVNDLHSIYAEIEKTGKMINSLRSKLLIRKAV
jgi:four helix bundle protein